MRTKTLPVKYREMVSAHAQASAGPYPNITGMKKQYWDTCGRESITVKCGTYLYLLGYTMDGKTKEIYDLAH